MDETSFTLAVGQVRSAWLRERLERIRGVPSIWDLAQICRTAGWNVHVYDARGIRRAMVKPYGGPIDWIERDWGHIDQATGVRTPEHALLLAMDDLCCSYHMEAVI